MIVDVIWPMRDLDKLARGYGDCGLLEGIFDHSLWTPQYPFGFEHHEVREGDFPKVDGAVVVVNCRNNVEDCEWLIRNIEALPWCLLILAGDEEWNFPWQRLPPTDTRRVWVQAPIPEHEFWASHMFPGGWYWRTREEIAPHYDRYMERPLRWFFAGQVTHQRRRQCVDALKLVPGGELIETDGFLRGVPTDEYHRLATGAKAVPSPSGPYTPDAARPLAAMEAGCVPILDMRKPRDPQFDYWRLVFGDGHPVPRISKWHDAAGIVEHIETQWKVLHPRVYAWWQQWKRNMAHRLNDDLLALTPYQGYAKVDDQITVIVTSSPIPSHPSTAMLEETIGSIRAQLPRAEIIVVFDGVRPEQEAKYRNRYFEYVSRALWLCNFEWHNVLPVVMPEWGHQANATREALKFVRTDQILFVEHDTPICGDIPWVKMIDAIDEHTANVIRLHFDVDIHPDHEHVMLGPVINAPALPMRASSAWWQRPHLASTDFYRNILDTRFPPESRTMIEDRLYGEMWVDCVEGRWLDWKVWIYTPEGNMQRSTHTDGRQGDAKYEMRF